MNDSSFSNFRNENVVLPGYIRGVMSILTKKKSSFRMHRFAIRYHLRCFSFADFSKVMLKTVPFGSRTVIGMLMTQIFVPFLHLPLHTLCSKDIPALDNSRRAFLRTGLLRIE